MSPSGPKSAAPKSAAMSIERDAGFTQGEHLRGGPLAIVTSAKKNRVPKKAIPWQSTLVTRSSSVPGRSEAKRLAMKSSAKSAEIDHTAAERKDIERGFREALGANEWARPTATRA